MDDLNHAPANTPATANTLFAALQLRAQASGVTLRRPPPEPTACCGRGCNGCVWEGFYTAAAFWREDALAAISGAGAAATAVTTSV